MVANIFFNVIEYHAFTFIWNLMIKLQFSKFKMHKL